MPTGFSFTSGCPGISSRGFALDTAGCSPPPPEEEECTDLTERGQQLLSFSRHVLNDALGNERTSWGFVDVDGEVWTAIGTGTCGGGNMFYDTCVRYNHYLPDGSLITNEPLISPNSIPAVNMRPGQSDEPMMQVNASAGGRAWVYPDRGILVSIASTPTPPDGQFWAKRGNYFYITSTGSIRIIKYDAFTIPVSSQVATWSSTSILSAVTNLSASDNFLWVLGTLSSRRVMLKISLADGSLAATIDLQGLSVVGVCAASDSIVYILCNTTNRGALYYYDGSEVVFVGQNIEPFPGTVLSSTLGMCFSNNNLYFGQRGASGFTTEITKCVVGCPDEAGLSIPTITGSGGAAGTPVNVTWEGVLATNIADRIRFCAAPTGGNHGAGQSSLGTGVPGGASDGTISFTIPGGTAPGDYVFQYWAHNQVFVCQSAVVVVT